MDIKKLFLSDKEAVKFWTETVRSPHFEKVMVMCKAQATEGGLSKEAMAGVNYFSQLLEGIVTGEETWAKFPNPGLVHEMPLKIPDNLK